MALYKPLRGKEIEHLTAAQLLAEDHVS